MSKKLCSSQARKRGFVICEFHISYSATDVQMVKKIDIEHKGVHVRCYTKPALKL